jgi:hemolysin-activating ACP:hemolysin acyltransferase
MKPNAIDDLTIIGHLALTGDKLLLAVKLREIAELRCGGALQKIWQSYCLEILPSVPCEKYKARRAGDVGVALDALTRVPSYLDYRVGDIIPTIRMSTSLGQIKIYTDKNHQPCGVLTWMWLSDWTINRITRGASIAELHPSEWNEGTSLCFRDICISKEASCAMLSDIREGLFPDIVSCHLIVSKVNGGSRLEVTDRIGREDAASFVIKAIKPKH